MTVLFHRFCMMQPKILEFDLTKCNYFLNIMQDTRNETAYNDSKYDI